MMTVSQIAQRLAQKMWGLDFARLPMTAAEELRDGLNAGLDKFVSLLPSHRRQKSETIAVDAPRVVDLTVTAGSKSVGVTTGFPLGFYASAAALAGKKLVFSSGSAVLSNRFASASSLLLPWLGASGAASGTVFDDGHLFGIRLDQFAGSASWQHGSQLLPLSMEDKSQEIEASPGVPEFWWIEPLGGAESGENLLVLRLHPAPAVAGLLSIKVSLFPGAVTLEELHASGRALPCDDLETAHLVNLCAVELIAATALRDGLDLRAIQTAAENSTFALARRNNPNPSGAHNTVGTPPGF